MKVKSSAWLIGAVMVGAVGISGCATKGFVRQKVSAVNQKVDTANGRLDQDDTHLATLDRTSQDALDRAQAAGKLAEGKFLYSMVLSDDSVKFPVDSSKLSPEAQQRLSDFADKLKSDNRNVYLEIQGHTDAKGPDTINT